MDGDTDRAHVRLAELVAALSLGIDLGFGQPMEHVLRQCLIASRLAERIGLDERTRAAVYYTALLVNVGCHSDAHEQAKWFGDDIVLKSGKYDHELRSLRGPLRGMRRLGSGNPPLHRFRIGLEFAIAGHRDVDQMIAHHAGMARTLGEQLELPDAVLAGLGGAYEMWDGHGWPQGLKGEQVPIASRLAMLAEFIEVAHRIGGVSVAQALARKRAGRQFDPALAEVMYADAELILSGLDEVATWDAVIEAEPALGEMGMQPDPLALARSEGTMKRIPRLRLSDRGRVAAHGRRSFGGGADGVVAGVLACVVRDPPAAHAARPWAVQQSWWAARTQQDPPPSLSEGPLLPHTSLSG